MGQVAAVLRVALSVYAGRCFWSHASQISKLKCQHSSQQLLHLISNIAVGFFHDSDCNTMTKRDYYCFPVLHLGAVQCEPRCCLGWHGSEGHAAGKSAPQQAGRSSADGRLRPGLGAGSVLPQRRRHQHSSCSRLVVFRKLCFSQCEPCMLTCLLACLPACLLARSLARLLAGLLACLLA